RWHRHRHRSIYWQCGPSSRQVGGGARELRGCCTVSHGVLRPASASKLGLGDVVLHEPAQPSRSERANVAVQVLSDRIKGSSRGSGWLTATPTRCRIASSSASLTWNA